MSNTVKQLGFIPTNRGEFDTTGQTRYYKDNVVQYRNGSYICSPVGYSASNPTAYTKDAPYQDGDTELNANWKLMASVGLIDNEPTAGSGNLVKSGGIQNELALGAVYDVSAHNGGAVFESLSALLNNANLSTLIPTAVRKGGMSIKFIQGSAPSSDNKYVQFRCMAQNFTTDVAYWQGVDNVPIISSKNLVESGGVFNMFDEKLGTFGDRTFNSNNYCGFYYSASLEKIMPAVPTFNGIILPLKEGGIYCVRNGYSAHIFSSYPVLNSNAGFVKTQSIDNSFTAASGDKYVLIDVQTQVTPTITVNYRVNGLQTDVDALKAQMLIIDKVVNGDFIQITYPKITPGTRLQKNVDCSNGTYRIKLELIEGETTTLYYIYARTSNNPQAKILKTGCVLGQNYDIEITDDENTYVGFQIMTQTNSATGSAVGDIYELSYVSQVDCGLKYDVEKLKEDSNVFRLEIDNIKDSYTQFVFTNKAVANRFIKEVFIDKAKVLEQEPNWGNDFYIHNIWKNHNNQYYRVYIRNTPTYIADTTKIITVEVNYQGSLSYVYNNTYGVYLIVNWDVVNDGDDNVRGAKFADICYSLDYSPSIKTILNPSGEPTIVSMNRNTNTNFANLLKTVGETGMASWVDDDGVFDGDAGTGTGGNIQTIVKAVADAVGIPVTFGIICDEERPLSSQINLVGGGTATKAEYMMSLQKLGHHFTAHPYHQGWYGDHYDITVVESLLIGCLVELQKANMLHSDLLIYPGSSSSNPLIVDIIRKWCVCGVVAGYGTPNHLGDSTKWQLKRTFINFENYYELHHNDQGFVSALQWYKDQVDIAAENGDWIIFGTHSYQFTPSDDTSNPNANTKGNLVLLMQYALSKGLEYRTLWDAYNRRKYLFDFKEINV